MSEALPINEALFAELPKRKVKKSVLDTLREFQDIATREGGLLPFATAALVLNLSKQRVHELVKEGTLKPIEAYGKRWLSAKQVENFVKLQREAGRPWHEPSVKEMWKASFEGAKEQTKKK